MGRLRASGTRWFSLSGRELLTLALAVGLVLTGLGLARGARWVWGRGAVTVAEAPDVLAMPPRMNLNQAPAHELALLPGIGPKTAAAIVEHRRAHGPFRDWDAVMRVPGIGPATVEKIRPYAMCRPSEGD